MAKKLTKKEMEELLPSSKNIVVTVLTLVLTLLIWACLYLGLAALVKLLFTYVFL